MFAVQPAVLYDSAVWSQTDSAVTLAMLLSVFLVARGRSELGFGVWAAGFLIKPHPIIVLPLLVYLAWRNGIKPFARSFAVVAGVWAVALSPWVLHGDLGRILHVYRGLFDADYEELSANAWNFWWFFDLALHPKPDQVAFVFVTYRMLGLALTVSAGFLALLYLHARPTLAGALAAAAYLAFAFYLLPISTHDRYLYPFLALLLPLAVAESRWRWLYAVVSVTFFFNLAVVAPPIYCLLRPLGGVAVHGGGRRGQLLGVCAAHADGRPRCRPDGAGARAARLVGRGSTRRADGRRGAAAGSGEGDAARAAVVE